MPASGLPQLAVLFSSKLLRNIRLGAATVINLTAGCHPCGGRSSHCPVKCPTPLILTAWYCQLFAKLQTEELFCSLSMAVIEEGDT